MSRTSASRALRNPAPVFAALGDATRLELVSRLIDGQPLSIAHPPLLLLRRGAAQLSKPRRNLDSCAWPGGVMARG